MSEIFRVERTLQLTFKALFPLLVVVMPQEPCSSEQTCRDAREKEMKMSLVNEIKVSKRLNARYLARRRHSELNPAAGAPLREHAGESYTCVRVTMR